MTKKMNWLRFNFGKLSKKVRKSGLSEGKQKRFNEILFNLYEAIEVFERSEESMNRDDFFVYKQGIYEAIKEVEFVLRYAVDVVNGKVKEQVSGGWKVLKLK